MVEHPHKSEISPILYQGTVYLLLSFKVDPYNLINIYILMLTMRGNINHMPYLYFSFIYLFAILPCFQHCTCHITTGSWKGRGNQYIQFVRVLYCKLPTNSKQLPAFPLEAVPGTEPRPQRWETRVIQLCHCGPLYIFQAIELVL